jgi:lipopolysaccharide transport system permease protein
VTSQVLELTGEVTPTRVLLRDLWRDRDLLPLLARKDFKGRYRSASLGLAWSVFLPLLQAAVLTAVFTLVARFETDQPYALFILAGVTTWSYYSQSLLTGSTAIVDTSAIAGRLYFPRLLLPAIAVAGNLITFVIATGVTLVAMVVFALTGADVGFGWTLLLLPVAIVLPGVLAYAAAANLAVLHVYFRDVRHIVSASITAMFFGTPIIYPPDLAGQWRWVLDLNPATGMVLFVRWTLFGEADGLGRSLAFTLLWVVVLLACAVVVYRRQERIAIDRL